MTSAPSAPDSTQLRAPPAGQERRPSRRKLRKGANSCWECKRRKIKCTFASLGDAICLGCRRRGTSCVGQDKPEVISRAEDNRRNIGEKIERVESLLSHLANRIGDGTPEGEKPNDSPRGHGFSNGAEYATPDSVDASIATGSSDSRTSRSGALESTSAALLAAFPSPEDTDILLTTCSQVSGKLRLLLQDQVHMITRQAYDADYPSIVPTVTTHPVILARQMLYCAMLLQNCRHHLPGTFSEDAGVIRNRLMTAVIDLVTTNDDLHGSLESLECLMLEGMYHCHYGNLRRSWLVYRKAMLLAQLMGVHRFPKQPLKAIDPRVPFDPAGMWSYLVGMDRQLCLRLGLPPGTCSGTALPPARDGWSPIARLERELSSTAARILERNHSGSSSYSQVQAIDAELLQLYQSMPEEFWRPFYFAGITRDSFDHFQEVVRLSVHVSYYHLLNQLHWPHMLKSIRSDRHRDTGRHEDYSSIACANASREILTRFLAYRSFDQTALCLRLVDFTALTAVMTLVPAHLDVHLARNSHAPASMSATLLAHHRLSDRALLSRVVEKLEQVGASQSDAMCIECAQLLKALLEVEAAAAQGEAYQWTATKDTEVEGPRPLPYTQDGGCDGLQIPVPYFGTICVSRAGRISTVLSSDSTTLPQSRTGPPGDSTLAREVQPSLLGSAALPEWGDGHGAMEGVINTQGTHSAQMFRASGSPQPAIAAGVDEWALQGVDRAVFDCLFMSDWPVADPDFSGDTT